MVIKAGQNLSDKVIQHVSCQSCLPLDISVEHIKNPQTRYETWRRVWDLSRPHSALESLADKAMSNLQRQYPNLEIRKGYTGPGAILPKSILLLPQNKPSLG